MLQRRNPWIPPFLKGVGARSPGDPGIPPGGLEGSLFSSFLLVGSLLRRNTTSSMQAFQSLCQWVLIVIHPAFRKDELLLRCSHFDVVAGEPLWVAGVSIFC